MMDTFEDNDVGGYENLSARMNANSPPHLVPADTMIYLTCGTFTDFLKLNLLERPNAGQAAGGANR